MTTEYVIGKVYPAGGHSEVGPIGMLRPTSSIPEERLHRLLLAARAYRDQRSQKALTELIEAAKDIE